MNWGAALFFLAASAYFSWELRAALRDKVTFFDGLYGEREWSPGRYWFGITLNVSTLVICLAVGLGSLWNAVKG